MPIDKASVSGAEIISKMDQVEVDEDEKSGGDVSTLPHPEEIPGTIASQSPTAAALTSSMAKTSWFTVFCRCVTCCNCLLVIILTALVAYETNEVQTLQKAVEDDKGAISALQDEVREKQEGKIEKLHQEVQQEHDLTYLTLAGIFTLLTCLISMFHMSSHLQKMNQPIIQRKIVAILWMSPIYSVTSFLTLIYPPMEGYMAIIKDFYESYCIYTFLSFLIVVLGRGSRENAVEVLAMHAHHLEQPTRMLSRWYDPPADTSDVAKANAVITECQIFAMQFVFIRPLTTVMYVVYRAIQDDDGDSVGSSPEGGNRLLRWLQEDMGDVMNGNTTDQDILDTLAPSVAPVFSPTLAPVDDFISDPFSTLAPTEESSMPVSSQEDFSEATKAYFKSFGFALAMIVNISVFFAFTGLLKFYHSVHKDLAWCRPWPKFLTIKGVVFLTFWQGCAILIFVNLNGSSGTDDDLDEDLSAKGRRIQNILICCEMLFFSLTHWCVFPAEEWEKGYEPPTKVNQPGIGLQDFVSDVGQIYRRRRKGRRRTARMLPGGKRSSPRRSDMNGLYHRPGTASEMSSTAPAYDEDDLELSESYQTHEDDLVMQRRTPPRSPLYHQPATATRLSHPGELEEEESSESYNNWQEEGEDFEDLVISNAKEEATVEAPPSLAKTGNKGAIRARFMSDGSSAKADDEDDDMELL